MPPKPAKTEVTPQLLLQAYTLGVFPMSNGADDPGIFWVDPKLRGIFPIDQFHVSRSLSRAILKSDYTVTVNQGFSQVVSACADRAETWINSDISALYQSLHEMGYAHSIEVRDGTQVIGGVYGVSIGAAFFGESMFSKKTNGSKIALTYLMARLRAGGYTLFDTQFITDHLASLGAVEIPKSEYQDRLQSALQTESDFWRLPLDSQPSDVLHLITQTS